MQAFQIDGIAFHDHGLSFERQIRQDELQQLCSAVHTTHRGKNWWIGDLAAWTEAYHPDDWVEKMQEWMPHVRYEHLSMCKRLHEQWPPQSREWNLSWSHYKAVTRKQLSRDDQEKLLSMAVAMEIPSDQFASEIRNQLRKQGHSVVKMWTLHDALSAFDKFERQVFARWPEEHRDVLFRRLSHFWNALREQNEQTEQETV